MLAFYVIETVQTAWASPLAFVLNKDDTLIFCIDYIKLNDLTVRDLYRLQRMDQCIDSLRVAEVLPTIDANSAYCQIEVDPSDR